MIQKIAKESKVIPSSNVVTELLELGLNHQFDLPYQKLNDTRWSSTQNMLLPYPRVSG
jgi:hypothetical protein